MAKELEFGLRGFDIITGTESGAWVAVEAINGSATFSGTCYRGDAQPSQTLADGQITYGGFTQIVVSAGTVKAYRNVVDNFDAVK